MLDEVFTQLLLVQTTNKTEKRKQGLNTTDKQLVIVLKMY